MSPFSSLEIIDPVFYERSGYPHAAWEHLREHAPISWWEPPGMPPFWAITRYRDIEWISTRPKLFLSSPLLAIFPKEQFDPESFPFRAMTKMDPPEHGQYRVLSADRFTPRALEGRRAAIESIVRERLDALEGRSEVDFVTDVAAWVAISVIAEMLGIPPSDRAQLVAWSNATMGATDPEFQEGDARATEDKAIRQQFDYFAQLIAKRRKDPADDLTSTLAAAGLDGKPLPDWELLSYVVVLMIAGNDTTRNAMSGGLLALLEHPRALERLLREPTLLASAVEEMLRWASPVIQFCRTPAEDVEIRGQRIHAGEALCLFYPSANRDREVFDGPFEFRIDRRPNPHLAFGVGEHLCLGANLARLELRILFQALLDRFDRFELAGPVERLRSSFVGGIKHLPVRFGRRPGLTSGKPAAGG